jgi:hypothetical protein
LNTVFVTGLTDVTPITTGPLSIDADGNVILAAKYSFWNLYNNIPIV